MTKQNEYYGSIEEMPEATLMERERQAERELIEYREEISRRAEFGSIEIFAAKVAALAEIWGKQ